jgi:FlaA1/EpsC-like NDP-sugar epimerase
MQFVGRRTSLRVALLALVHVALIPSSTYVAYLLRFDGNVPPDLMAVFLQTLPWLMAIRGLVFVPFGLYGGLWRYAGIWDLTRIVLAVCTSSLLLHLLVYRELGPGLYPRGIVVIDTLLLVCALGGMRLLRRMVPYVFRSRRGRRVLISGAGDADDMIVREMRKGGG